MTYVRDLANVHMHESAMLVTVVHTGEFMLVLMTMASCLHADNYAEGLVQ